MAESAESRSAAMLDTKTSFPNQVGATGGRPTVMAARAKNCLRDTLELMEELATFVEGRSPADMDDDSWLESALQQQVRLVGLGLDRILKFDPTLTDRLPHAATVGRLSETILREYNNVDMEAVWNAASRTIPTLAVQIADVLRNYPVDESSTPRRIAVIPLIVEKQAAVADLCRRYGARRLAVFGSAVNGSFNPESSDLDFVVDFESYGPGIARRYFDLADQLERLFDRSVDLATIHERTKPWFRKEIETSAVVIYEAGNNVENKEQAEGKNGQRIEGDGMRILTLGVYGYTDKTFRAALEQVSSDVFVDTRRRRGVRGHQYAFANNERLQALLQELGIPYVHRLNLAPPESAIRAQDEVDRKAGIARHDRDQLSPVLRDTYQHDVLDHFDSKSFVDSLGNPESLLLFCVEGNPAACHRTLLANRLREDLGGDITHIVP